MGTSRVGVSLAGFQNLHPDPRAAIDVARLAEELGCATFWVPETVGAEAFTLLGAVGASTRAIGLGTGIVPVQLRPPTLAAMAAATLQGLWPGREVWLGVGVSSPVIIERWHGVPYGTEPVVRVREYLELAGRALAGGSVSYEGRHHRAAGFRLRLPDGPRSPGLVVAALNPGMLRLAGELGDAVLLAFPLLEEVDRAVAVVRQAEERAGRPSGSCRVMAYLRVLLGDLDEHLPVLRREVLGYLVAPAYARRFTAAGFARDVLRAQGHLERGARAEAADSVGRRFVEAVHVVGGATDLHHRLAEYARRGVDDLVVVPLPLGGPPLEAAAATLAACLSAPL